MRKGAGSEQERGIPYLSFSGYDAVEGASKDAPHIMKPVSMDVLMSAMEGLLAGPPRVSEQRLRGG